MKKLSSFPIVNYLTIVTFFLISSETKAQIQDLVNYKIEVLEGMQPAAIGTYQFEIDPKYQPAFTSDILYFIERERKESEDVYIQLMPCASVYIPSRQKISSPDFQALPEFK